MSSTIKRNVLNVHVLVFVTPALLRRTHDTHSDLKVSIRQNARGEGVIDVLRAHRIDAEDSVTLAQVSPLRQFLHRDDKNTVD
jgi:hypothetical protein